jgi:hypothetical protein
MKAFSAGQRFHLVRFSIQHRPRPVPLAVAVSLWITSRRFPRAGSAAGNAIGAFIQPLPTE